ncbi:hypothetical protein BT69DRAFT_1279004 [Atractiella rhizophila]|nr:hypothetical protein BT69DRAFT_1279004 [Atractiella rhizophila]
MPPQHSTINRSRGCRVFCEDDKESKDDKRSQICRTFDREYRLLGRCRIIHSTANFYCAWFSWICGRSSRYMYLKSRLVAPQLDIILR